MTATIALTIGLGAGWLCLRFEQALAASGRWLAAVGVVLLLGLRSASLGLVMIGLAAVWALRREAYLRARRTEGDELTERLPHLVDETIQRLRSGQTLRRASAALGQAGTESQLVAATLEALAASGGPAVPALQRLRYTLVGAVQASSRRQVEAAQGLASAALLAAVPALFAVLVAVAEPAVGRFYLHEVAGFACLSVAVGLGYLGWVWMRRTIDSGGRSDNQRDQQLLAALVDLLAVSLGAGQNLTEALATVQANAPASIADAIQALRARGRAGLTMADALPTLTEQLGPSFGPLTAALIVNEQGGAPVGALLQRLAEDAEQARRLELEVRSKRMPVALLPPLTCCMLPATVLGAVVPLAVVSFRGLGL